MKNSFDFASAGVIKYAHTCGILRFDTPIPLRIRSGLDLTSTIVTRIQFTDTRFYFSDHDELVEGKVLCSSKAKPTTGRPPPLSLPPLPSQTFSNSRDSCNIEPIVMVVPSDSELATVWQKSKSEPLHAFTLQVGVSLPVLNSDLLQRTVPLDAVNHLGGYDS